MAFDIVYSVTNLLYSFVVALIVTTIIFKWFRERKYPPGPAGIPLFGYALFLGKNPSKTLGNLKRKYGDVISFYMGPQLSICVQDYFLAKELLCNPKLLYRPEHLSDFLTGRGGMAGMNGEEWQEQRRFTFYTMRNLGLGKGLWETMTQEAITDITEELKSYEGRPVNLEDVLGFFLASNNISLLLGRHLDKEKDAKKLHIIHASTREFMKYFGQVSANAMFPRLRKVLETFHLFGYHKFYQLLRDFEVIFKKEVEERLKSPESLEKDDFIGCFYREMKKRETETEQHTFTMENLFGNLLILFIASNDSTMATITFSLLYMAEYPDIQKRVQEEIDSVAGRDGVIYYDDRAKYPYTMATVFEVLRDTSIAPLNPPRLVTEDMTINDCHVPEGSYIFVNLWSILHDPRYFKEPMQFNPERFLDNDKAVKSLDGFFPFSVGRRNCPGEGVAIMTAFLYFSSFMQKFKVITPPGKKAVLEPIFGGVNMPKSQELCFLER